MGELPDLKKRTVVAAIVRKWGERICVMGSDTRVSKKPRGACTPSSLSKAFRLEVTFPTLAGAKAATELARRAAMTSFVLIHAPLLWSWEVMHAYFENALFCDTWRIDMIAVVILHKLT